MVSDVRKEERRRPVSGMRSLVRPVRPPRPWVPWIVLTISLLSTAAITWVVAQNIRDKEETRFESEQSRVIRALQNRMDLYVALLNSGSGLFSLERTLTFEEFRAFHRRQDIRQRFAGTEAVGFARYVPVEDADSLQQLIFRNYMRDIPLRPVSTPYDQRFAVTLITPPGRETDSLIGVDLYATASGRRAIDRMIRAGSAQLYPVDSLIGSSPFSDEDNHKYVLISPAYDLSIVPESSRERFEAIRGFFFDVFTAEELLLDVERDVPTSVIAYAVFAGSTVDADRLLYASREEMIEYGDEFRTLETVELPGTSWTFAFMEGPDFGSVSGREVIPLIAFAGLLFSLGLFYLTRSQVQAFEQLEASALALEEAQQELADLNRDLEDRVRIRTVELENSNNELKAFAYSVSHDLRAPLRGIDGFSKFLLEDYGDRLDDTGRDYLRRIREGTQRMGDIIDDLLTLSRVTRWEMQPEDLDMSDLAEQIIGRLREEDPERSVEVDIEPHMIARADRRLVTIVLENLLENAWKFTSKKEQASIRFRRCNRRPPDGSESMEVYCVEDDGAGFEQEYASELFDSFRRLHSPHDFTGTGIGLATVKRAISRHNGEIWGEGTPDVGAGFYFSLG